MGGSTIIIIDKETGDTGTMDRIFRRQNVEKLLCSLF